MESQANLVERVRQAGAAIGAARVAVEARAPFPLAERFDHSPEAAWGPPELLAHVSEMLPYWLGEVERILAGSPDPVPFGRIGDDPLRIAIIGRDRTLPSAELFARTENGVERWVGRVSGLSAADLVRRGLHQTRGEMTIEAIVERQVIGHLEEHARQLGEILAAPPGSGAVPTG
jgi:DinB superfamily